MALKRVQQQQRDLQHKRDQQQRQEQEQARKQREEAERREQQLAQQEQAHQQQAREAAAQARAAAEAASRQYLPIAKEAPDYPQRALDRNIEGNARSPTRSRRKARSVTRRWSASAIRCSSNRRWQRRGASVTSPGW